MKKNKFPLLILAGLLIALLIGGYFPIEAIDAEITLQTQERRQMGFDITMLPDSVMTASQLENEILGQLNIQNLQSQGITDCFGKLKKILSMTKRSNFHG